MINQITRNNTCSNLPLPLAGGGGVNIIKLRKESERGWHLERKTRKNEEIYKKDLTKEAKCAVDFINEVNEIDPC